MRSCSRHDRAGETLLIVCVICELHAAGKKPVVCTRRDSAQALAIIDHGRGVRESSAVDSSRSTNVASACCMMGYACVWGGTLCTLVTELVLAAICTRKLTVQEHCMSVGNGPGPAYDLYLHAPVNAAED